MAHNLPSFSTDPRCEAKLLAGSSSSSPLSDIDLKTLIESVYDEVLVVDREGVICSVTTRVLDPSWGVARPEDIVGLNILEVERLGWFRPSVTRLVLEQCRRVCVVQESRLGRQILAVGNPVFDENGELIRVVVASRDITELRALPGLGSGSTSSMSSHVYDRSTNAEIVFRSAKMRRVLDEVSKVAAAGSTVILYGESGVGKELIARAIHRLGRRSDGPFVKINCGAIPDNLLESELFGYERGAFTGANQHGKPGLIELANRGVLFLDEIGEMPLNLQVKLLRVLQERELIRIGGTQLIHVDVQIVAASNKDLEELVEQGSFREDLFYRLYVVPITIPPLRERPADIVPLALHFLDLLNQKYGTDRRLTAETFHLLEAYPWPGNVRELQNVIERLVVTAEQDEIGIEHVAPCLKLRRPDRIKPVVPALMPLQDALEIVALDLVEMAMERCKTTRKAATVLGVSQATVSRLYQRLKRKKGDVVGG